MNWTRHWTNTALALACGLVLCGCSPAASSQLDEEKEPHFLEGKSRASSMDYKAAIESFEQALEVNPHSASAHFELACLLTEKEPDPAAAIYHYESYMRLRPNTDNADIVKQRIVVLKQDLARTVAPPSTTPALQREFERLAEENRQLRDEVEKWRAYYANRNTAAAAPPVPNTSATTPTTPSAPTTTSRPTVNTSSSRTYKVQAGDTLAAIARKYGVKLDTLIAANSGLDPRRMKVGQTLNIPAQ